MSTLTIDWTRCDGHGLCRALLPDRVELDEWGYPILRDPNVDRDELGDARRAVAACPALALSLRDAPVNGSTALNGSIAQRATASTR